MIKMTTFKYQFLVKRKCSPNGDLLDFDIYSCDSRDDVWKDRTCSIHASILQQLTNYVSNVLKCSFWIFLKPSGAANVLVSKTYLFEGEISVVEQHPSLIWLVIDLNPVVPVLRNYSTLEHLVFNFPYFVGFIIFLHLKLVIL